MTQEAAAEYSHSSGSPSTHTYLPALDGLRAVAVLLVLLFHAGVGTFQNGFVGVDVFFVLSGFLITRLLLAEMERTSTINLRSFYARRARRLLPASLVVVAATVAISLAIDPVTRRLSLIGDARAASLYVANWHFIGSSRDYFAADTDSSPFLHFWSLAIEEQFYVVFPVALLLMWRLARRRRGLLLVGLGMFAIAGVVTQIMIAVDDPTRAYFGTEARMYQLIMGGAIAVASTMVDARRAEVGRGSWYHDLVATLGAAALLLLVPSWLDLTPSNRGLLATVAAMALVVSVAHSGPWTTRLVGHRLPASIGRLSYGIYLWHWPVVIMMRELWDLPPAALAGLTLAASAGLAAASHHLLEQPVRRAPRLDRRPVLVTTVGLALSAAMATSASAALDTPWRPLVHRTIVSSSGVTVDTSDDLRLDVASIDWQALDPRLDETGTGHSTCTQFSITPCVLVEGSGPRWLLIGDSHSQTILPAMVEYAQERDIELLQSVELGCGWEQGVRNLSVPGKNDGCFLLRSDWPTWLVDAYDVEVVVAYGVLRPASDFGEGLRYMFSDRTRRALPYEEALRQARSATVAAVRAAGAALIVIEPTPFAPFNPLECLSATGDVGECAWRDARPSDSIDTAVRSLAAPGSGVASVDLDDVVCPRLPTCLPFLDGEFSYSDDNHVRSQWWLAHLDELGRRLDLAAAAVGDPIAPGEG
ncbi:MAG: acyltransferase family protein [Ilumatobacteraceae bacterium]